MKDIFDRIGVYDFFGICGAGALHIIYFLLTKFYIENNSIYEITKQISAYDSILLFLMFFILSYFVGTILHELGKFLMENIFKSFTISTIRKTINSDKFNTEEIFIKTLNPLNKMRKDFKTQTETLNPNIPLHKALSYFKHKGNSILLDKYHSLYGLSRGIWIGCILNMAIIAISYINTYDLEFIENCSETGVDVKAANMALDRLNEKLTLLRERITITKVYDDIGIIIEFIKKNQNIINSKQALERKHVRTDSKISSHFINQAEYDRLLKLKDTESFQPEIEKSYKSDKIGVHEIAKLLEYNK